ncbi:2TM domain-containing protein [Flavobacterium sp. C4GT6]|uniref:2TM domain-containing protein n=1 Tax=Flavobacterium sp. C4GT6 TaxID=3103818 RepID=UPI002ECFF96E
MRLIIKELLKAVSLGAVVFVILYVLKTILGNGFATGEALFTAFSYTMLYSVVLYMVNVSVFIGLDRVFGKGKTSVKRIAVGILISFAVSGFFVFLLRVFEDVIIEGRSFSRFFENERLSNYYFALGITLIVTLLIHAFHFYKRYQENRVKKEKIIAGTASAKFETLKNQIDPHFLFNSLNVLSSLIEENPDNAQRFTTSLSKVYRYVLEQRDKELVSIQEELSFAKTYMNLLKMRFENSLFYEPPTDLANPEGKVVPLSLQLLLENSIKHNIVSPQKPLHIRIYEKNGSLVVENNLQKKEVLQDRKGVGLENIVSRYAILTSRKVEIEQTTEYFTVYLPILTKQIEIMDSIAYSEEENDYYKAQKRVEDIKGFYGNLMSYLVVVPGLGILNYITSPQFYWFLFPLFGWGLGVIIHGLNVFNFMPFLGRDWEERKIREFIEKEKSNKWQ